MNARIIVLGVLLAMMGACASSKKPADTAANKADVSQPENPDAGEDPAQKPSTASLPSPYPPKQPLENDRNPQEDPYVSRLQKNLPDSIFAFIDRTPCYGRCPTYKVHIYQSGYATYEGIRFVEKEGMFSARISSMDMEKITKKANAINYVNLQDVYDEPVTDLPSTITAMRLNGKLKVIKNRRGGPPELKEFEKVVDEVLNAQKWSTADRPANDK